MTPIYDFTCEACGHQFEALTDHRQSPTCASCGSFSVYQGISAHKSYTIKGDNSASVTPKRFAAGK